MPCEPDLQYSQPFDGAPSLEIDTQKLTDGELLSAGICVAGAAGTPESLIRRRPAGASKDEAGVLAVEGCKKQC